MRSARARLRSPAAVEQRRVAPCSPASRLSTLRAPDGGLDAGCARHPSHAVATAAGERLGSSIG